MQVGQGCALLSPGFSCQRLCVSVRADPLGFLSLKSGKSTGGAEAEASSFVTGA